MRVPPPSAVPLTAGGPASLAAGTIAAAKRRIIPASPDRLPLPSERVPLSPEEAREAAQVLERDGSCMLCAGIHPGGVLACPRLASFRLERGELAEGTFWPDGSWDAARIVFEDQARDTREEAPGDEEGA